MHGVIKETNIEAGHQVVSQYDSLLGALEFVGENSCERFRINAKERYKVF
jgi:hypothetical protein